MIINEDIIFIDMIDGVKKDLGISFDALHTAIDNWLEAGPFGMPPKGFAHVFTFNEFYYKNDEEIFEFNSDDYNEEAYKPLCNIMIDRFGLETVLSKKFIINIDW
jgi:hypothetical protein